MIPDFVKDRRRQMESEEQKNLKAVEIHEGLKMDFGDVKTFFKNSKMLVLIFNESGILKWNATFEKLYGADPSKCLNKGFDDFVVDARSYYGRHRYKDVEFHFQREYVLKRHDGQVASLMGEIEEFSGIKVFLAMDNSDKQSNDLKLETYLALKDAMIEINQSVIGIEDVYELLELIVEKTVKAIPHATYGSALQLHSDGYMRIVSHYGFTDEDIQSFRLKASESFLFKETEGRLDRSILLDPRENKDIAFNVVQIHNRSRGEGKQITATISSPIMINGTFFGSLNVDSDQDCGFTHEDVETVEYIRNQVEVALSKHRLYEEMLYLARYDELSAVYNRRYFEKQLNLLLEEQKPFCLVLFDISHLRSINDTYGHAIGDAYIKKFIETLRDYFEDRALIGRYGGDEFVAAFPGAECNALISRIDVLNILFLKEPMLLPGNAKIHCQFHYGIAEYPMDAEQLQDLVSLADRNLRSSKGR